MREPNNIREVESAVANSKLYTLHSSLFLMGFIFWPKSSRYVSERPAYLPTQCKRVGVFVDEDIEMVKRIAGEYCLDYIQLHGHESPDYCAELAGYKLIKACNIATAADFALTEAYEGVADMFLFDTKGKSVGGNGEKFDWSVLSEYRGETPFLLSGGIGPDDAKFLTSHLSPLTSKKCVGIDLNSRFELAPGLKDINKLKQFLEQL
jgi:phosphoribosylanthranilate isomerase